MARTQASKPYARPDSRSADSPGGWKHDLHAAAAQRAGSGSGSSGSRLASRLSTGGGSASSGGGGAGARGGDLLSRLSGHGTELLPSTRPSGARQNSNGGANGKGNGGGSGKMLGWDANPSTLNSANPNAGVELFPAAGPGAGGGGGVGPMRTVSGGSGGGRALGSRIVASGMAAAGLGQSVSRPPRQERGSGMGMDVDVDRPSVSIMGASKVVVRVENLAPGTTPEDVMSAFSPSPITSAILTYPPPPGNLVSVDLAYATKGPAEELILQYNGAVADGNALKLSLVKAGLSERMGNARSPPAPSSSSSFAARVNNRDTGRSEAGRELMGGGAPSKMYSDSILASNAASSIITVTDSSPFSNRTEQRSRAEAWNSGRSLASRVGR